MSTSVISPSEARAFVIDRELRQLLEVLPTAVRQAVDRLEGIEGLIEVILDLGRRPEARFPERCVYLAEEPVTEADLSCVTGHVGAFTQDNRAGIEGTLHRISALRNRRGDVIGLTLRVGRALTGTAEIIRDAIESGRSLLLLGPPGVGKTTLLREAARLLADEKGRRVMVVDTSNEIAGDGDVPHSGIGNARRMQVPTPDMQHRVMIEAVENHMPEVVVIDEIGTHEEAMAARTIAERGVQLVGTAHGVSLVNLIRNPTLCDLIGGIQAVTLSDEEAARRGTQKTVLERKAPPTFSTVVEIQTRNRLVVTADAAAVVDALLRGREVRTEIRERNADGGAAYRAEDSPPLELPFSTANGDAAETPSNGRRVQRIFPVGISRVRLERAIRELGVAARIADMPSRADIVLSLKAQRKRRPKKLEASLKRRVAFVYLKSNTVEQIKSFLREHFSTADGREAAIEREVEEGLREADDGIVQVQRSSQTVELAPRRAYVRRRQHERVQAQGLYSESQGNSGDRHVVIFPRELETVN